MIKFLQCEFISTIHLNIHTHFLYSNITFFSEGIHLHLMPQGFVSSRFIFGKFEDCCWWQRACQCVLDCSSGAAVARPAPHQLSSSELITTKTAPTLHSKNRTWILVNEKILIIYNLSNNCKRSTDFFQFFGSNIGFSYYSNGRKVKA